jgi:hypothetical protein
MSRRESGLDCDCVPERWATGARQRDWEPESRGCFPSLAPCSLVMWVMLPRAPQWQQRRSPPHLKDVASRRHHLHRCSSILAPSRCSRLPRLPPAPRHCFRSPTSTESCPPVVPGLASAPPRASSAARPAPPMTAVQPLTFLAYDPEPPPIRSRSSTSRGYHQVATSPRCVLVVFPVAGPQAILLRYATPLSKKGTAFVVP